MVILNNTIAILQIIALGVAVWVVTPEIIRGCREHRAAIK